jgi:hypothetical protein
MQHDSDGAAELAKPAASLWPAMLRVCCWYVMRDVPVQGSSDCTATPGNTLYCA